MSDYRRCYVPGGSFFFTVVTERRAGILANDRARDCLRTAIRYCKDQWSFHIDALVILPDHIHAIWTMPQDDADYSKRWGIIKKNFTESWLALGGTEQAVTATTKTTSIICISIRSNTDLRAMCRIGLIPRFIIGSGRAFIRCVRVPMLKIVHFSMTLVILGSDHKAS